MFFIFVFRRSLSNHFKLPTTGLGLKGAWIEPSPGHDGEFPRESHVVGAQLALEQ
jgi:hypothetical protein